MFLVKHLHFLLDFTKFLRSFDVKFAKNDKKSS
jgi:hypothetical protein